MKSAILLLAFMCSCLLGSAQDIIMTTNGQELHGRVLEIGLDSVLWQPADTLQGRLASIVKRDVFMIKFENGTKEVFEHPVADSLALATTALSPDELYWRGQQDAKQYYKGNGAMWGSAASSMVMFPLGLAGSIAIGATPAKVKPDRVSDVSLMAEQDYLKGYTEQANRKKRGKALAGVGIGAGIQLGLIILIIATMPVMP